MIVLIILGSLIFAILILSLIIHRKNKTNLGNTKNFTNKNDPNQFLTDMRRHQNGN